MTKGEWRAIESAPRDFMGEPLIIGRPGFRPTIGYWSGNGWTILRGAVRGNALPEPTHWMPLPDPPLQKAPRR